MARYRWCGLLHGRGGEEGGHDSLSSEVDIKRRTDRPEASGPQRIARQEASERARARRRRSAPAPQHNTFVTSAPTTLHFVPSIPNFNMLVWAVILLAAGLTVDAAKPDPPPDITTLGSQKLATASDCSKPVAFSGSRANVQDAKLVLSETLLDQGVGYAASTGTFTTFCPGYYQFSFAGYGSSDLRMTLKRKLNKTDSWEPITSTGPKGGANTVLLRMALGDQVAIFVDSGKPDDNSTTFSGYRIARE